MIKPKLNNKIFLGTTIISIIIISISTILIFKKDAIGFNIFNSSNDCTPYNIFIEKGNTEYTLNITWRTKGKCLGFIQYGTDSDNLEMIAIDTLAESQNRIHSATLEKLVTTQTYYYLINSGNTTYGNNSMPLKFILKNL